MSTHRHARPREDETPPYYAPYVALMPAGDFVEALEEQGRTLSDVWRILPEAARGFRYADGKWSVEELICHVVDIERVFAYRAMCFLRGLPEEQPGVDQDIMVPRSGANVRSLASLAAEFLHQRASNAELFRHLTDDELKVAGRASGHSFSVRGVACILYGHAAHHERVLQERYASAWG